MKFSMVGSFNLADGYLGAAKALKRLGFEVDFIPAHRYLSENPKEHVKLILKDIEEQSPDYVLWWRSETLSGEQMELIYNKVNKPFILYSWDDPNQFDNQFKNIKRKCKYFDVCYTCCEGSIEEYLKCGAKRAIYCPPGYDPEIHFPEFDEKYVCDISLVCTNLYHGDIITKKNHVSRKTLMEHFIFNFPDLDIRIYGSESLKEVFPNNYHGWMPFNESHKVFFNSKININTHIRPDGYKYLNERVAQIMGSQGFLLVDEVNGMSKLLTDEMNCEFMRLNSPKSIIDQVSRILEDEDYRKNISENARSFASKNFTWDNWARTVSSGLK